MADFCALVKESVQDRGVATDAEGVVSVRRRKEGDKGSMKVADFLEMTAADRKVVR